MSCVSVSELTAASTWQGGFLAVLPAVRTHARLRFRYLRAEPREEAVQAAIATACVSYRRLLYQGKADALHASSLAAFAVHRVQSGRMVGSRQNSRDLLSPRARRAQPSRVQHLEDSWQESLVEARRMPPGDLAAFNIDFGQWLSSFPQRDRQIITALASGENTAVVAGRFGLTAGRISQLRRRYEREWHVFQGEWPSN